MAIEDYERLGCEDLRKLSSAINMLVQERQLGVYSRKGRLLRVVNREVRAGDFIRPLESREGAKLKKGVIYGAVRKSKGHQYSVPIKSEEGYERYALVYNWRYRRFVENVEVLEVVGFNRQTTIDYKGFALRRVSRRAREGDYIYNPYTSKLNTLSTGFHKVLKAGTANPQVRDCRGYYHEVYTDSLCDSGIRNTDNITAYEVLGRYSEYEN